jgi:molecular chaperone GrpE
MSQEPRVIKVTDKRGVASGSVSEPGETPDTKGVSDISPTVHPTDPDAPNGESIEHDFLDDLKRLQADFDNYRKRVARDQAVTTDRVKASVIEGLLPVLDNFERAIAHGEGGEGVELVFKEFKAALEREGLEEVPSEGVAFDPNVHEAVESRETEGLEEPTIIEVYRRGYLLREQLLRPAMVVVGRPTEQENG